LKSGLIREGLVYRVGKADDASQYPCDPTEVGEYDNNRWAYAKSGTFVVVEHNDGGRYVTVRPFVWVHANGTRAEYPETTVWDDDHHQAWRNTHMELSKNEREVAVQRIQPVPDDWQGTVGDWEYNEQISMFTENAKAAKEASHQFHVAKFARQEVDKDRWAAIGQGTKELLNISKDDSSMEYGFDWIDIRLSIEDVIKIEDLVNWKEDNAFL